MTLKLSQSALEKEIKTLLSTGLTGKVSDFTKWVKMESFKRMREVPEFSEEWVIALIDVLKADHHVTESTNGLNEFTVTPTSPLKKKVGMSEEFEIIGTIDYSPMQYVRSRIEYFLKGHNASEDNIIDITIGAVEAIENAVKYGDGKIVRVSYAIDRKKNFKLEMYNTLIVADLASDIEKGKYSGATTLMRGMMVMEKLFDKVDLDIVEEKNEAHLTATKYVG